MKLNKLMILKVMFVLSISLGACQAEDKTPQIEVKLSQMKSISELAVLDVYYHNVAKYKEEDASGFWFWKKDKNIWVEYSGIVKIGIDASKLQLEVKDNVVTISLPQAEILSTVVDEESLTKDSFIIDSDSAKITAADVTKAVGDAQDKMRKVAESDSLLIDNANQRVKKLLSDYVANIGALTQVEYEIVWNEVD